MQLGVSWIRSSILGQGRIFAWCLQPATESGPISARLDPCRTRSCRPRRSMGSTQSKLLHAPRSPQAAILHHRSPPMNLVHLRCAGLDVHKKTVVACVCVVNEGGEVLQETRS